MIRHQLVTAFGALMILIGSAAFICGILNFALNSAMRFIGVGFWGGGLLVLTGFFGAIGGHYKNPCLEVTFLVLSIISAALLATAITTIASVDAGTTTLHWLIACANGNNQDQRSRADGSVENVSSGAHLSRETLPPCGTSAASLNNVALAVFGILAAIVAMVSASAACCAVCNCRNNVGDSY